MENEGAVQKTTPSGNNSSRNDGGSNSSSSPYHLQGVPGPGHHIMQHILQQPPAQPHQLHRPMQYHQQMQTWRGPQRDLQYNEQQAHTKLLQPMYQQQQMQLPMHDSLGLQRDHRQQQGLRLPFNVPSNAPRILPGQDIDTIGGSGGGGGGDTSEYHIQMLQKVAHPQFQAHAPGAATTHGIEGLATEMHGQIKSMPTAAVFHPGQYHPGNTISMSPLQDARLKPLAIFSQLGPPPHHNLPPPPNNKEGCHCRKSRCLKLYCQCFAAQALCHLNCKCLECANHPGAEKDRLNAMKAIQARNPDAFAQKFTPNASSDAVKLDPKLSHAKGCKCRKSMCLKRYCECFSGGVKCGAKCQCSGCLNREGFVVYENAIEGKRDSNALSGGPVGSPRIQTDQRDERLQAASAGDETAAVLNELSRGSRMTMPSVIGESVADVNGEVKGRPAKRHQVSPDEKIFTDEKVLSSESAAPTDGLSPQIAQSAAPHDLVLAASELACLKQPGGDQPHEHREV